jgi:hypothetical protein
MIKNKRGDVTITILVLGVFLLGAFALLSFFMSDFKLSNSFESILVMEKANSQIDEYLFYRNSGVAIEDIYTLFEIKEINNVKYLHNEVNSKGNFGVKEKELLFSVDYPLG